MKMRKLFAGIAAAATLLGGMAAGATSAQADGTAGTPVTGEATFTFTAETAEQLTNANLKAYKIGDYVQYGSGENVAYGVVTNSNNKTAVDSALKAAGVDTTDSEVDHLAAALNAGTLDVSAARPWASPEKTRKFANALESEGKLTAETSFTLGKPVPATNGSADAKYTATATLPAGIYVFIDSAVATGSVTKAIPMIVASGTVDTEKKALTDPIQGANTVNMKNTNNPGKTKTVEEPFAAIGDTLTYTLTGTIANPAPTEFKFTDKPGKGLTIKAGTFNFYVDGAQISAETAASDFTVNTNTEAGSELVRVGLVKFAGDKTDKIGDDMYRSGGYTYNYSQIVSNLTADMNGLKNKVSKLKAAGATRADNGFNRAVKVMGSASARTDAKKVVIFFADGSPTSSNGFEKEVANNAVTAAKKLKDGGAAVYSIGIFASANPSSLSSNENQFMHAVSSNFPKATKYNQRGEGNIKAGYYKSATNASELNAIFDEIQKSETTTSAYTKVTMEDTLSGYVELADSNYKVVAKDASGKVVSLTKNVDYTLTYDASTKKFTVAFLKPLVNNVTYTLEYNVKPTQKAYDEYAANLNAGKDGYDGVKGDANTDLPGNATSSNQPGFHANDSACLAYSADGVDHACGGNPYPHPVIQVVSSTLHIEKQWSGDGDKPESITVDIKQGNGTYKTVTLKRDDSGKWSTDVIIPAGAQKTYTVTEVEPDSHLWKASYQHKVGDGNLADGNAVTVPESTASQEATVIITNTLKQTMLTHAIGVQKELKGRDWKDSDEFTFKLKADDSNPDAPMPASCKNQSACTVTVKRDSSDDHVAYFGDITYDAGEAEYTYLVTENAGNASAMYYSQAEYRVVVSVMKDGTSGEWKAVVESVTQLKTDYGAAGSNWDETQPMLFTNQYISASSLPLTGRMGAERWWQIAAGGVGVLALLAVAAADQWRRKKRLS